MKRLLYILLLFFVAFQISAQENVFILVDVSKSGVKKFKEKAGKNIIQDIVMATYSTSKHPDWKLLDSINTITNINIKQIINSKGSPLVTNNSVVGILEIGDYNRHLNNRAFERISPTKSFEDFYKTNYPINVWKDNNTIIELPMAWLASFLKSENISNYFLFVLSDEQQDKGNPGTGSHYSIEDKRLIADYGKGSKKPEKICTFNAIENGKDMFLTLWSVDLSGNPITPTTNTGIIIPPSEVFKIELTNFKGGTSSKPIIHKENKLTIGWFCKNAPKNAQYKIRISPIGISGEKTQTYKATGNSYSVSNLSNGKWKITVSSDSANFNASSATTTIEINTGGSYWFLWLLLIAGLGFGGYLLKKKIDADKLEKLNSMSNNDSFSSGSTLNTNSDNSEYF
jgi:hypothetical protein